MVRRQGCLDMTSSLQWALTHKNGRSGIAFIWPAIFCLSAVIYSSGANNDPQLHKVEPVHFRPRCAALHFRNILRCWRGFCLSDWGCQFVLNRDRPLTPPASPQDGWYSWVALAFFHSNGWTPVSLHEGWPTFFILVIFSQAETSSRLVNLKTLAISPISVLASFMHYQIVRLIPDRFIKRLSAWVCRLCESSLQTPSGWFETRLTGFLFFAHRY